MQEVLITYFNGEKNGGLLLVCIGVLGLAAALTFFQPRFALRSFAVTLAIFAIIEIAIGAGLFLRTGPQVRGLIAQLESDSPSFFANEGTRIARVQRNFVIVQYIEVALIVIATIVAFAQKNRFGISGVALALLLNAAILLAFDIVAERRGDRYLGEIKAHAESGPQ